MVTLAPKKASCKETMVLVILKTADSNKRMHGLREITCTFSGLGHLLRRRRRIAGPSSSPPGAGGLVRAAWEDERIARRVFSRARFYYS